MKFGKFEVDVLDTGLFGLDGGAMFGVVPKTIWSKLYNHGDDLNRIPLAARPMLIRYGDKKILVDTGNGTKYNEKLVQIYNFDLEKGNLDYSLSKIGISRNEITDVILTHLHFDHCGGAVSKINDQLFPTFKNATYWTNKNHWDIALKPNAREKASFLKENMLPLQEHGQLKFINQEVEPTLSDKIKIKIVHGHTESMMLPLIHYNDKTILYCADLIPSMFHISLPWVMAYDMQPLATLTEKESILNEAFDKKWLLFFEHDLQNECCTLVKTERGIRQGEVLKLADVN